MLLGPVRTHLTTWAGNSDCIAKINSRGEMRAGAGLGKLGGWWEWRVEASAANRLEFCWSSDQDWVLISNLFSNLKSDFLNEFLTKI